MYNSGKENKEVASEILSWLNSHGVSEEDQQFIASKIKRSDKDENFWYTAHDIDTVLHMRNPELVRLFHQASKELDIKWSQAENIENEDFKSFRRI